MVRLNTFRKVKVDRFVWYGGFRQGVRSLRLLQGLPEEAVLDKEHLDDIIVEDGGVRVETHIVDDHCDNVTSRLKNNTIKY